jgi:1-piperideine-2-carboxylate/1-pyrroline-2-carboxylate reductase [NAD(P)H]
MMTADSSHQQAQVSRAIVVCDQVQTAASLNQTTDLMAAIAQASREYECGAILSPERMVVALRDGGVLLSMPATANDISIHKLVNVQPANARRHLPTIHGIVTVCDSATGEPLCLLDGPEVTGRRTAAVSLLAIKTFLPCAPTEALLIGTGMQAAYHLRAFAEVHPKCKVWVRGMDLETAQAFCLANHAVHRDLQACEPTVVPENVHVIITLTTATHPVYNEAARAGRLLIGVGAFKPEMAELGKVTLDGSDIYADDPKGAQHEAGDLLQAGIDWTRVASLAWALQNRPDLSRPIVFKSVGTGAWDLAASRVALKSLGLDRLEV